MRLLYLQVACIAAALFDCQLWLVDIAHSGVKVIRLPVYSY